jgi:hypothetical protein
MNTHRPRPNFEARLPARPGPVRCVYLNAQGNAGVLEFVLAAGMGLSRNPGLGYIRGICSQLALVEGLHESVPSGRLPLWGL